MLMRAPAIALNSPLHRIAERVNAIPILDAASGLTLFLVVVFGFDAWWAKAVGYAAFLLFLLQPQAIRTWPFWAAIAGASTLGLLSDWYGADNHKYLLAYWLWVVTLAHAVKPKEFGETLLVSNARFFAVFIFLGAALQKFFSPTYMSGEMFETLLLLDERFRAFASLAGVDLAIPDAAGKIVTLLKSPMSIVENNELVFPSNDHVNLIARAITWYDIYVQFAIGLFFLPNRRVTDMFGHAFLLFFIFTTYLPAPVFGFGWTLAILGFVLARSRFQQLPILYLAAFLAILLYQAPWREWVIGA
jgi:hypothetical protein